MRIFVVLVAIALAPLAMAVQNQPSSTQNREGAQQTNASAPVSVNCNCATPANETKDKPQGWHKLVTWPEGIATWALILTLGAIIWQAVLTQRSVGHIEKQTGAIVQSTKLQEAQLEQWLVIKQWSSNRIANTHAEPNQLFIECTISNPTSFPLTLTEYAIGADDFQPQTQILHTPYLLAPQQPFSFDFTVPLSPEADKAYLENFWFFWIRLTIRFEDILRQNRSQEFSGKMICHRGGSAFQPHRVSGRSKDETQEKK